MKNRIINFIHLLRDSNIRISIAESIEACKALQISDITNKNEFKIALRTTLIKNSNDLYIFDKIFDLYFAEISENNEQIELSNDEFSDLMQQLQEQMDNNQFNELGEEKNQSFNSLNNDNFNQNDNNHQNFNKDKEYKDILKQGTESDIQQLANNIANSRKFEDWELENINAICTRMLIKNNVEYLKSTVKCEVRKSKQEEINDKYEKLKEYLKDEIEKAIVKQFGKSIISDLVENNNIMDMDLGNLTLDQLKQIEQIIKKIAKKLATHVSRKEKHAKNGKVNIKTTIKSSLQHGNVSSELRYKKKKKTKSELIVLCDISGSVWMYVSFMLQLVIGIQNAFDKVTSYIFIDHIRNVTDDILSSQNIPETVSNFLGDRTLGYGTDYGNVFKEFDMKNNIFNKKAILIIMGDAENTGDTIGDDYLKNINEKCKAVYWLNPNEKDQWYGPYSELDRYEKYCKEIYTCSTLRELEDFIKKLVRI